MAKGAPDQKKSSGSMSKLSYTSLIKLNGKKGCFWSVLIYLKFYRRHGPSWSLSPHRSSVLGGGMGVGREGRIMIRKRGRKA
jgi:hypothetical protein